MIGQKRGRTSSFNRPGSLAFVSTDRDLPHIRIESLFQPDVLIPFQHQATQRRRFNLEPERMLMLAVLEDAIVCFQDNLGATCRRKQVLYADAEEWILDDDTSYLFSFENVCEALNFNPLYLREGLMRWRDAKLGKTRREPARKQLAS